MFTALVPARGKRPAPDTDSPSARETARLRAPFPPSSSPRGGVRARAIAPTGLRGIATAPSRPARRRGAGRRGDFTPRPTPPRAVSHTDGVAMEPTAGEALPQPRGARGTADGQRRGAPGGVGAEGPRKGSAGGPRKDAQSCGCRKVGKRRLRVTCRARGWCLRPAPVVTPAVRSALPQHPCFNGRDTQARSWWQGRCWKLI